MRPSVVDYNLQTRDVDATGAPMVIREPMPREVRRAAAAHRNRRRSNAGTA